MNNTRETLDDWYPRMTPEFKQSLQSDLMNCLVAELNTRFARYDYEWQREDISNIIGLYDNFDRNKLFCFITIHDWDCYIYNYHLEVIHTAPLEYYRDTAEWIDLNSSLLITHEVEQHRKNNTYANDSTTDTQMALSERAY